MDKTIYITRHCEAEGQSSEAQLTEKGVIQAKALTDFYNDKKIDRIISSPFLRAVQTIKPLAERREMKIEIDSRLAERVLSSISFPDWMDKLEKTYNDMDLKYEGRESSNEAMSRIVGIVNEIVVSDVENTLIVTHGNIMSLLLNYYDHHFGFEQWKNLSNPDVYQLRLSKSHVHYKRLWRETTCELET